MVHGIFSFGIAYSLFFKSISIIGIGRTILITAFWPILALIISILMNRLRGRSEKTSVYVIVSAALIVSASVIELAY
jgi:drug/metabolite transporter (DMT)-like permease